ncbi:hypothetical protein [Roseateles sp. MS654]|uniref:hypothetical protein n=1 Tax=Roseateles sp. MS654 TaxID=3412685 RepID=UPI003C2AF40F
MVEQSFDVAGVFEVSQLDDHGAGNGLHRVAGQLQHLPHRLLGPVDAIYGSYTV